MIHFYVVLLLLLKIIFHSEFTALPAETTQRIRQKRKLTDSYPYLRIEEDISIESGNSSNKQSKIIQDASGNLFVVYAGYRVNHDGIYGQVLDTNNNIIKEEFKLSTDTNQCYRSSATILTDSKIVVVWHENIASDNTIMATILNPDYSEFKSPFQVDNSGSGVDYRAKVVSLITDRFVVTWLKKESSDPGYFVHFRIFDNNGDQLVGDTRVNLGNVDTDTKHSLVSMPNGQFVSVWSIISENKIQGMIFNSNGEYISTGFTISPSDYTLNEIPGLLSLDEDNFIVFWSMYSDSDTVNDVYGQIFDINGFEVQAYFKISDTSSEWHTTPSASLLDDGGFVVIYTVDDINDSTVKQNIYAKRFDRDWTVLEGERLVNFNRDTDNQNSARVCQLSNGGYAVSWQISTTDVFITLAQPCRVDSCLSCKSSIFACDTCLDGYYPPNCQACSIPCETCNSENECESCISPLIKHSNDCLCPDERTPYSNGQCYCPESSYDTHENPVRCQGCSLGCASCNSLTMCHECFKGYYLSENLCLKCQDACADCRSFDECTECTVSYELNNTSCECPEYFIEEDSVCIYKVLTFTFNESYFLEFSESLARPLSLENIMHSVFKPGDESFNFEIDLLTLSLYSLKIDVDIPDEAENIQFVLFDVVSESGAIVKQEDRGINQIIYVESSGNLDEQLEKDLLPGDVPTETISTVSVSSGVTSATGISFVSMNPSALWSYMNLASMIYFIPLQNIPIPAVLKNFTVDFDSDLFDIIPNIGELTRISEQESENTPEHWVDYGIYQTNLIINMGNILFFIISGIICLPLLVVGYFISCKEVCKKFLIRNILEYKYCFFIRTWIQIYTHLMFYSLFILFYGTDKDFYMYFAGLLLLLGILSPVLTIYYIVKAKNIGDDTRFSTIFEEFRYEKGCVYMLYYPLFFSRRLIFCLSLFVFYNVPLMQIVINSACSITLVLYLLVFRPYRDFSVWVLQLFSEVVLVAAFILSGFYLLDLSEEGILILTQCITFSIMSVPIFMLFVLSIKIFKKIYDHFKSKKRKTYVLPIKNDKTVQEIETNPQDKLFCCTHKEYIDIDTRVIRED